MGRLKDISADIGITLICCIFAYAVAYICGNVLRRCSARGKLAGLYGLFKKIGTYKPMGFVRKHILVFIILVPLFGGVAVNALTREKEPYIYIKPAIASQHDVSELFLEDDTEEETNQADPVYHALHIDEVWLGHRIDTQLLEHYRYVLSPIYTKGLNVDVPEGTVELLGESTYATVKSRWLEDTKKYLSDYNKFFRPNSLYQAARGLVDFCLAKSVFGISTRIEAAADAVSMMDRYVAIAYRDGLENVTVQPNYVAHILGKLMLNTAAEIGAAEDKSSDENHAGYEIIKPGTSDAMLLQAYIFFEIGFDLSEPGSKIYALTCYYKALAAQRLIERMVKCQSEDDPKDQGLFNMLGSYAVENYDLCEDIYKKDPRLFDEEPNVMSRISSNKKALEGLGFTSSAKDYVAE